MFPTPPPCANARKTHLPGPQRGLWPALAVAALLGVGCSAAPTAEPQRRAATDLVTFGSEDPLVVVTVFTDPQCPACRHAATALGKLVVHWPQDVQVQLRHKLIGFDHGTDSAIAAQAARAQGRYGCVVNRVYAGQRETRQLSSAEMTGWLAEVAGACGADGDRFAADVADGRVASKVASDDALADRLGVRGTPTFLVNGREVARTSVAGVDGRPLLTSAVRYERMLGRVAVRSGVARHAFVEARIGAQVRDLTLARWLGQDLQP